MIVKLDLQAVAQRTNRTVEEVQRLIDKANQQYRVQLFCGWCDGQCRATLSGA
jgi:hypothetical protein